MLRFAALVLVLCALALVLSPYLVAAQPGGGGNRGGGDDGRGIGGGNNTAHPFNSTHLNSTHVNSTHLNFTSATDCGSTGLANCTRLFNGTHEAGRGNGTAGHAGFVGGRGGYPGRSDSSTGALRGQLSSSTGV